jgi:hypothetical protein
MRIQVSAIRFTRIYPVAFCTVRIIDLHHHDREQSKRTALANMLPLDRLHPIGDALRKEEYLLPDLFDVAIERSSSKNVFLPS